MVCDPDPRELLAQAFGPGGPAGLVQAPGRVNLIGEHIDYHGFAVLPMALRRYVRVAFRARDDRRIRAASAGGYGVREFAWSADLAPAAAGDWENYLRAAALAVGRKWEPRCGIDAAIVSDLPAAAGLSSSSALMVAFALALLRANGCEATFAELMEVLPEAEQFVGTRGGAMDHAASLASQEGCASLIEFEPLSVRAIPVPEDWAFLVAHSLTTAEKSGAVREAYNAARMADPSLHATGEARRVRAAVTAMEQRDAAAFGALLLASHASLRDRLRVSCAALDRLVDAAMDSGALGARLTGAGFGGCVVAFTMRARLAQVRNGIIHRFYAGAAEFDESLHLIDAQPGPGALQFIKGPHASPNR